MFQLAVEYLLDDDGLGRSLDDMRNLIIDVGEGSTFAAAFESRIGIGLDEYEARFFDLMDDYLPQHRNPLFSPAWFAILSLVVTAFVLGVPALVYRRASTAEMNEPGQLASIGFHAGMIVSSRCEADVAVERSITRASALPNATATDVLVVERTAQPVVDTSALDPALWRASSVPGCAHVRPGSVASIAIEFLMNEAGSAAVWVGAGSRRCRVTNGSNAVSNRGRTFESGMAGKGSAMASTNEQEPPRDSGLPESMALPTSVLDGDRRVKIDGPTLAAVSALAWATANMFHEIVGHVGAAVVLGIPVRAVSTTTAFIEWHEIESATQMRIVASAATLVNVPTGVLALAALRWLNVKNIPMR